MEISQKQRGGGGNADCSQQEEQILLIQQVLEQQWQADKDRKVECFRRLNKYVQPGQILFAGSSLMEQFPVTEFAGELALPLRVYNRGIGGFTTLELLEAMDACIYGVRPAFLYLNIGTNDLNDPQLTIEELIRRYEQILEGIREHLPETKITLLAYYPVNEAIGLANPMTEEVFRARTNKKLIQANQAVEELAARYGAEFKNLNSRITDEAGNLKAEYTVEGMHIYPDGYRQVWDQLKDELMQLG